jgi:hypothetical protein
MATVYAVQERRETLAVRMAREGWIVHPTKGKIKFIARPFQRKFWQDRSRRRLICKARQIGMSQAVGAEAIERAMKSLCTILMISRNEDQAIQLLGYCKTVYNNLDRREVSLVGENTRQMVFANGSRIVSLPANKGTGRGFAASHIYFDEAAWALYADDIWQAIAPSIALGGTITVLSSPDGDQNLFGRIVSGDFGKVRPFTGTSAPDGTWSYHHIPWTENPAYTTEDPGWYDRERPGYTLNQWKSEFEASIEGSGERVFQKKFLELLPDGWIGQQYIPQGEAFIEGDFWYMPPVPGRVYMNSWDLGRKHDPTVGFSIDVTEEVHQVVAFERFHNMDWDDQEERIINRLNMYEGYNAIDASGVGDPVWQHLTFQGYNIVPIVFGRVVKPNVVDELVRSTEHELLKLGLSTPIGEMLPYRRDDKKLVQDCVMSLGIGEYVSRHLDIEQQYDPTERIEYVSRQFAGVD